MTKFILLALVCVIVLTAVGWWIAATVVKFLSGPRIPEGWDAGPGPTHNDGSNHD